MKKSSNALTLSLFAVLVALFSLPGSAWADAGVVAEPVKPAAVAESANPDEGYSVIRPGDMLSIDVYKEEGLTGHYRVGETGNVIFPMVGETTADGMTIESFRKALTESLKKFIKDPLIRVDYVKEDKSAIDPDADVVLVLGQVKTQGAQALGSVKDTTLLKVIAQAGGFAPASDPRSVKVVSRKNGKRETHVYNAYDVLEGRIDDPAVYRGDVVYVSESAF